MKTDKDWEARALEMSVKPTTTPYAHTLPWMSTVSALQLGRVMAADAAAAARERAIADVLAAVEAKREACKEAGWPPGTWIDVVDLVKKMAAPKTREQVLEEALHEIKRLGGPWEGWPASPSGIARRALEWKP